LGTGKTFLDTVLYTRDQEGYEKKVVFLFIYSLFCNSNTFSQFSAVSSIGGIFVVILIPLMLLLTGVYWYVAIFVYKRLSLIDLFVLIWCLTPIYNAIASHLTVDVKILKALINAMPRYLVVSASLMYFLIKSEKITIKQYCLAGVMVGWFDLILYVILNIYLDPQTYKADESLVGYNPSKGGYIWRFGSVYIIFALSYHFVVFLVRNKFLHLIATMIFLAYMFFLDKQRTEILSVLIPIIIYMFFKLRWYEVINRLSQLVLFSGLILGIIYCINPMLLQFTADMFINFFKFMMGMETGEASADSRIIQFTNAYDFFMRHPTFMFWGIGYVKPETLYLEMGKFIYSDTGIVGILVAHGIIGTILQTSMFLYPIYVFFKVKHYRNDIYYNMGMLGCVVGFTSGMFSGGYALNAFGIFYFFAFVEYFRVKEKIYWKHKRLEREKAT